ncbi:MAG: putative nucleic acid-binding protein [Gammaproteobacteria bacterium]|jgi:predicted nucleic acid-binding protein
MILLDTNVVSEVMRVSPAEAVLNWLNEQQSSSLCVSSITIGEIAYGLRILPDGKRRSGLNEKFERFIAMAFAQRVIAYDESAARMYGEIMASRKEAGRPMSIPDGQIAAIARTNHLTVATRNSSDFEQCGVDLLDPFLASG